MAYSNESNLNPIMQRERDLLFSGFSYREVEALTGVKIGTIKERNRIIYAIDLRSAFRARFEREGFKSRYVGGDAFGNWFSGYFDGEGCLTVFYRDRNRLGNITPERRVGVQISCRYDDADVLRYIHKTLSVGVVWDTPAKGTTRPAYNWRVENASDLTQVILPIFDSYPLRSKKRLEYTIWKTLVINQYVNTLGGTSTRVGASVEENAVFKLALQQIRDIRHPI